MSEIYCCPICKKEVPSIKRYPNYLCSVCKNRVTDESGRLVQFGNDTLAGDDFSGRYKDTLELYHSKSCWVDGIKCTAQSARFGGIVILTENFIAKTEPDTILVFSNNKIIVELNLAETYKQYEGYLKKAKNPEKALIAFLNFKSSYHVYKLKSDYEQEPQRLFCPECDSENLSIVAKNTSFEAFQAPQFYYCKECQIKIPEVMIIWMLNHTHAEAKEKWNSLYKPELDTEKKVKQGKLDKLRKEKLLEVQDIQFVDEQGQPIESHLINFDELEFADEWGRVVDYKGELQEPTLSEIAAVTVAEKMLTSHEIPLLISHCETYLTEPLYPKSARLYYLLGYGYANSDEILKARHAFLNSILNNLPKIDSVVFANYMTSCFNLEDTTSALEMIEMYFESLDFDGKRIVLDSLKEAIRVQQVTNKDISAKLKKILNLK